MQMHVDVIGRHQDGQHRKDRRGSEFVFESCGDAGQVAVAQAERWVLRLVLRSHHRRHQCLIIKSGRETKRAKENYHEAREKDRTDSLSQHHRKDSRLIWVII
jgi:hypothetical protein